MQVAFDHQVFLRQRVGGVSRYVCELARHLALMPDVQPWIVAPLHLCDYFGALDGVRISGLRMPLRPRLIRHLKAPIGWLTAQALRRTRPDVLHETHYAQRSAAPRGVPVVVTVHDMIHERFPQFFAPAEPTAVLKRAAVARADRVICISAATRDDLCERLGLSPQRVSVIHHGVSLSPTLGTDRAPALPGPYALYVGQRGAQKNFAVLVEAWARSAALRGGVRLVCFGGGPFTAQEHTHLRRAGLADGTVVQMGGDDAALAAAYRHALMLVFPSLYEGFGLPVLEAMALGCPVLSSDCGPLREVGGEAADYLPAEGPDASEAWAHAVQGLAGDGAARARLRAAGLARAARFTWERCASATHAVYRAAVA